MNEDTFLKQRQEREAARQAKSLGPSSETQLRSELLQELQTLNECVVQLVEKKDEAGAVAASNTLRERIQSAADTNTLPAHEMKQWNKTLSNIGTLIDSLRSSAKPTKKFAFKSSARPAQVADQLGPSTTAAVAQQDMRIAEEAESVPVGGVVFVDLKDQTVFVPPSKAVFVRRCTNCVFLAAPTAGSFFISDCVDCTAYVCCHQMRIKSCKGVAVYVWCSSVPVIESCVDMRFGPYDAWKGLCKSSIACEEVRRSFSTHDEWAASVGEQRDLAHAKVSWRSVDDFHWLKQSQSPNWRLLEAHEWILREDTFPA